ncbi:type II secretion system protein [Desulfitobacterium sp. THU1]|uniref:type IV pilus modification PilV family protein n=1 Tax=Desulfitobacterium sp. THU1 TaxID=3138072 RepID=UPI00311E2A9D
MRGPKDQGMTVLEVVIAITIFMIGITFVLQSDAVSHKYFNKGQMRQQMLFYAAGLLEAYSEGVEFSEGEFAEYPTFTRFRHEITTVPVTDNPDVKDYLEQIEVKVFLDGSPIDPEPVILRTYRVNYDE